MNATRRSPKQMLEERLLAEKQDGIRIIRQE